MNFKTQDKMKRESVPSLEVSRDEIKRECGTIADFDNGADFEDGAGFVGNDKSVEPLLCRDETRQGCAVKNLEEPRRGESARLKT